MADGSVHPMGVALVMMVRPGGQYSLGRRAVVVNDPSSARASRMIQIGSVPDGVSTR